MCISPGIVSLLGHKRVWTVALRHHWHSVQPLDHEPLIWVCGLRCVCVSYTPKPSITGSWTSPCPCVPKLSDTLPAEQSLESMFHKQNRDSKSFRPQCCYSRPNKPHSVYFIRFLKVGFMVFLETVGKKYDKQWKLLRDKATTWCKLVQSFREDFQALSSSVTGSNIIRQQKHLWFQ